jgi:pyruvate/2-oxoglutarate dehydrogenase complex dihydrolipoamide dehydrogenase (E3) component
MTTIAEISPPDVHNAFLLENVHPPDWVNPAPAGRYNLVVVGGGTAGLVSAAAAAGLGARVALVERHLLGGDCLNVGCVPSKTLIRSARAAANVHDASRFGIDVPENVEVDFAAVMERVRRVRAGISPHDSARRFRDEYDIDVFLGGGTFTSPDTLQVEGVDLRFERAVIATGARAAVPSIPGLADAGFLTNETIFNLTERPRRLAILGGGPIGCELAQAFARLGSEVSIIETGAHFLPREDADAAAVLRDSLERDGVDVRLRTSLTRVDSFEGRRRLHLETGGREQTLETDAILVAVGRAPNVDGLGLEAANVRYSRKGVEVDDRLRTSNRRIFAAGDVCSSYKFTHAADAMARIVIRNAFFGMTGRKRVSALTIPWCTYTDPEIAHVGMYERDAEAAGVEIRTFTVPMSDVDRAIAEGDEAGFVRIHVKKGSDTIVGATIVGSHAGEMISEITTAMAGRVGLGAMASVIHPYPTRAEAIRKAGDAYNRTRLTPGLKKLFGRYFAWRR